MPLGVYVHVPFCASRCGYCDFTTYTAAELPGGGAREAYARTALQEVALAGRALAGRGPADTVFFGGGTPTLLPAGDLALLLDGIREHVGLADGAEVTVEANPESVGPRELEALPAAGVTRLSIGMQHAAPHVLTTLDRRHTPGRPVEVAHEARAAGIPHVSLDVIYGTPGETAADWDATLDAVLSAPVDHVSAYALIVEPGTKLAAQVRRGVLPAPDDDVLADRYLVTDDRLAAAGFVRYEMSNWATTPEARCAHNLGYWRGGDWWGVGTGAHSHVGGVRWWNVKHPSAYAARLAEGGSPEEGREVLTPSQRHLERILLETRLLEGLPVGVLGPGGRAALPGLVEQGLVVPHPDRVVLTREGLLKADSVTLALDAGDVPEPVA